jgi:hypothetical protein
MPPPTIAILGRGVVPAVTFKLLPKPVLSAHVAWLAAIRGIMNH